MNKFLTSTITLILAIAINGFAQQTFIDTGSSWKYLDNGSNQGTAWQSVGFNDATWASGNAKLGYGDYDVVTAISYGPNSSAKYVTTYFRKAFTVANPALFTSLSVSILRDDGAIVYLNGTEIYRGNMPTGSITYTTYASSALGAPAENTYYTASANASLLIAGTNVIAVEVHQANGTSSDLGFDFSMTGNSVASVIRGPYLQVGTPTSIIVKWRTDAPCDSKVNYGTSLGNLNLSANSSTLTTEHEVQLTGLSPNTRYYYSIGTSSQVLAGGTSGFSFITSPVPGTIQPIRAWVVGDNGTADNNERAVRDAFYNYNGATHLDLFLMLGDNAYNSGTDAEYQGAVFQNMYESVLQSTVLWPTPGNHEFYNNNTSSATETGPYYDIFTLPKNGEAGGLASGSEAYYSFDYGNVHFISLDSYGTSRASNGAMASWLQNDLAATSQDWIIAFFHHPPYTKGSHNSDTETGLIQMRENILPILEDYGVDVVMAGHSHSYERSYLLHGHYDVSSTLTSSMILDHGSGKQNVDSAYTKKTYGPTSGDGAVFVVAGSSGKISGGSLNHPAMYYSVNELGSVVLDIDANTLNLKFINNLGVTRDYFTLIKESTVPNQPPTLSCPSNIQVSNNQGACSALVSGLASGYSDPDNNVTKLTWTMTGATIASSPTSSINDLSAYTFNVGTTDVTYVVSDTGGLSATCSFSVTVLDGEPPIVLCKNLSLALNSNGTAVITAAQINNGSTDNCSIASLNVAPNGFTCSNLGPNTVVLTVTDLSGNSSTCQATVTLADNTAPTITSASGSLDATLECSNQTGINAALASIPSATDNCAAQPTIHLVSDITTTDPNCPQGYTRVRTWNFTDGTGNTSNNYVQTIVVDDNTPPTFNCPASTQQRTINAPLTYYIAANGEFNPSASSDDCGSTALANSLNGQSSLDGYSFPIGSTTVTWTIIDHCGNQSSCSFVVSVTQNTQVTTTITKSITAGSDDAEEYANGTVKLNDSDLELINDGKKKGDQTVGLRFLNINIPQGATIDEAYIQFTVDEKAFTNPCNLIVKVQDHANAPAFSSSPNNISSRQTLTGSIQWSPPRWNPVGAAGPDQATPDIKSLVQGIVNKVGWSSGNCIVFIIEGTGKRVAESYEGSNAGAAQLVITFTTAVGPKLHANVSSQVEIDESSDSRTVSSQRPGSSNILDLNVYPNPLESEQNLLLAMTVTKEGEAILSVYQITGQIAISKREQLSTGFNELSIPCQGLKSGMYLLRIQMGEEQQTVRFVIR